MNLLLKRAFCRNLPKITRQVNNVSFIHLCKQISPDSEVTNVYVLLYFDPQDIVFKTTYHEKFLPKFDFSDISYFLPFAGSLWGGGVTPIFR